ILVPVVSGFALPYIKPWSIRFGIPAICTLVAMLVFISGTGSYVHVKPKGSTLTRVCRVFVASTLKIHIRHPNDVSELYEKRDLNEELVPNVALRDKDNLKRSTRGQGNTFFLEQANKMNRKVGKLKVPLPTFLMFYDMTKSQVTKFYKAMENGLSESRRKFAPAIGIALGMILAVLCCITAAKVEERRISVIKKHGLLEKPDNTIPMTIFWLLPQFLLLGGVDALACESVASFFHGQVPASMKNYMILFTEAVFGAGIVGEVLSVFVVGRISEQGGQPSWFGDTLNKSRLDNYYWTLAALSLINLFLYAMIAILYAYRDSETDEDQTAAQEGFWTVVLLLLENPYLVPILE
ncbi:hypothetical protein IFM89_031624, partial [Coptis chinensis]